MLPDEVNILVVDDVNAMRIQVRDLLRGFGFEKVTVVGNGEEAIDVLGNENIHLILCDWHMAPIDGYELLTQVRKLPNYQTVPFIMVTAESARENVIQAIESGVDDFLIKPLTRAKIQNKVYKVLIKKKVLSA